MSSCPTCQQDVQRGALYCPYCRAPLVAAEGDPLVGRTVRGAYLIQQHLGAGGMGQVYRATQLNLSRTVAVKLLRPALLSDPSIVQRFHREARAASQLNHPNVISVTDFGQDDDGTLFMVMEFVPGRNLLRVLRDEFPLGERRVVHIACQILSALAQAHAAGIVHRDLKPENVMVETRRAEPDFVKVLDFGIAKIQDPDDDAGALSRAGLVIGTPAYMSPEQATEAPLDARSDLYSLGVILYELLTGRHPFTASSPTQMAHAHAVEPVPPMEQRSSTGHRVSPALEAAVMRALEKNPAARYGGAEEMRAVLATCELDPELAEGGAASDAETVVLRRARDTHRSAARGLDRGVATTPRTPARATPAVGARPTPRRATVTPARRPTPAATLPAQMPPRAPDAPRLWPRRAIYAIALAAIAATAAAVMASRNPSRSAPRAAPAPDATALAAATAPDDARTGATHPERVEPQRPEELRVAPQQGEPLPLLDAPRLQQPIAPAADGPGQREPRLVEQRAPPAREAKPPERREAPRKRDARVAAERRDEISTGEAPAVQPISVVPGLGGLQRPQPGSGQAIVSVTADPEASVYLGRRRLGASPLEILVVSGRYTLRLHHETYGWKECAVNVIAGERRWCQVTFSR